MTAAEDLSVTFTPEEVTEIAFTAAGAATGPLLADHPRYVFPCERVAEGVRRVLRDAGIEAHGDGSATIVDRQVRETVGVSEIESYLDSSIRRWRAIRDGSEAVPKGIEEAEFRAMAPFYVDAFQSARVSLLGGPLPEGV